MFPAPAWGATKFAVEWTGRIQAQVSETYTLYTESDDGVVLYIKPTTSSTYTQLVNDWNDHGPTEDTGTFAMSGGQFYDIKMDVYNNGGPWEAGLMWSSTSTPKDFVPPSQLYSGVAPAIPTGLTVVAASGTTTNVNWNDNSNNETGFTLERTNPDNSVVDVTLPPNTTSYQDSGLTPGSTYSYKIRANNFVANSAYTAVVPVTIPVIPPTPSNGHVTAVTTTSISLAWQLNSTNSTNRETGVAVFRKLGSAGTFIQIASLPAGTTSYTDNGTNGAGLLTGQYYDFHIQAFNVAGATDFTGATVDTLTLPPSGLSATAGIGLINLSWTAPTKIPENGVTYNVYRGTTSGAENATPIATGLTTTSYADVTATPGQPYFYIVKAVDTGGPSAASNEINSTAASSSVPAPSTLSAMVVGTQINLSWSSVGAAMSYNVYRSTSPGGEGVTPLLTGVTGTTYSDLSVQSGLTYYYQVTSVNGSGESARSVEASAVLTPLAPTNVAAALSGEDAGDIDVTWQASAGAVSYSLFRSNTPGGEGTTPYAMGISGTVFTDNGAGAVPNTTYYYTVVALNAGGQSPQSTEASFATPPAVPATPTATIRAAGNVALSWGSVVAATSYNVYRSSTPGTEGTIPLATGLTSTSFVDSTVSNGGTFYYEVTSFGMGGESVKSGEASVAFAAGTPQGPSNFTATSTSSSQVNLSWTAPGGTVTGYNIFRGTAPGAEGSSPINGSPILATNYTDSGLTQNTHYYYTVRAVNGSGAGPASSEANVTTLPFIPVATITPLNPNTVTTGPNTMQIVFNEAVTGFTISSLSLSRSGGPNLLTAAQTLTTSDNTTFTLNNLSSLDVLGGTYTLKFTAAGSGVTDGFGDATNANATSNFVVNPTAPEVNAIYVSSSAWQQSFLNYLANNGLGDAQLGYRLMGGPSQLAALPWANLNIITVVFSRDVNITTSSLNLVGSADLAPPPGLGTATYSYNSTTFAAQWVFHASFTDDKYLLNIPSAAVTSKASGQALDGEFVNGSGNLLPSGNATTGGDFNFQFNILPGDVDQNGAVNALDGANVRLHFLQFATTAGYNPLLDTFGKGEITGIDFTTVQNALFSVLPNTDPTPPGQGGGGAAAATAPATSPALSDAPSTPPTAPGATSALAGGSSATTPATSTDGGSGESAFQAAAANSVASATTPVVAGGSGDVVAASDVASGSGLIAGVATAADSSASSVVTSSSSTTSSSAPTSTSTVQIKPSSDQTVGSSKWNSSVSTITAEFHAGSLTARDAVFAELDGEGPLTNLWRRVGRSKQAGGLPA